MELLTKEQKMEMVSKAIDAGFDIKLSCFDVKSDDELDEKLSVFDEVLEKRFAGVNEEGREHVWMTVNRDREFDDGFTATIFIDSLRGGTDEPT